MDEQRSLPALTPVKKVGMKANPLLEQRPSRAASIEERRSRDFNARKANLFDGHVHDNGHEKIFFDYEDASMPLAEANGSKFRSLSNERSQNE